MQTRDSAEMRAFLLIFLTIYACMHAFFFMRVRILVPSQWPFHAAFIVFLALMVLAPMGTRLLEQAGFDGAARTTGYVGYFWMAFLFLSFCALVLAGLIDIACRLVNALTSAGIPSLSGRAPIAGLLIFIALVCVYGYFEAENIRVERVVITTDKLPETVEHLRIVQISDVHLGLIVRSERLAKIVDVVRKENPDILVSTGDLLDGSADHLEGISKLFESVHPPLGKFAVTGNHEFYAGIDHSIASTHQFGFTLLRGEHTTVGGVLNVVGVDDPSVGHLPDESTILSGTANGLFTLLLKHRPETPDTSLGLFDLQLSGHTHKGQIFPFSFVTGRVYPRQSGLSSPGRGSMLYTSRGTGTWGPPIRVLSPPEVTVIELVRKNKAE